MAWLSIHLIRVYKTPNGRIKEKVMNVKTLGLMSALVTSLTATSVFAHEENNVVYKGDSSAKKVCLSIIKDDTGQLNSALRSDRLRSRQLGDNQDNFRCNDMALIDFAEDVGAYRVSQYLNKGNKGYVDMEEVASR
jgi:hypothetical protein